MPKLNKIYELWVQEHDSLDYFIVRPPMSVEFNIERNVWAQSSDANFKIYNLSATTRGKIFRDRFEEWEPSIPVNTNFKLPDGSIGTNRPGNVQFYGGYEHDGKGLSMLFNGQLHYGHSTRRGPEFITELECLDLSVSQYASQSARTLAAGRNKKEIIEWLHNDIGSGPGIIGPGFDEPLGNIRGVTLQGNTLKLLHDVTNGNWYSDLGIPIAIKDWEVIDNPNIRKISPETGMINVPIKANNVVIATLMFTPEIIVGQYIQVETAEGSRAQGLTALGNKTTSRGNYDGNYKVLGIKHAGIISGTHDAQTITTVSLIKLTRAPVFVSLPGAL